MLSVGIVYIIIAAVNYYMYRRMAVRSQGRYDLRTMKQLPAVMAAVGLFNLIVWALGFVSEMADYYGDTLGTAAVILFAVWMLMTLSKQSKGFKKRQDG